MAARDRDTARDPLERYRARRDFAQTPEPGPKTARRRERELAFVIQRHDARRLHYDFRLELDGTLKSWAVPKGPSLDPGDKRMAVEVEDHPLAYGGFEGTIPEGHYGAGEVIVWDHGTWAPLGDASAGLRDGHLKFELRGQKLHGRWALVRMKPREREKQVPWLLIKEKDEHARPGAGFEVTEALPGSVLRRAPLPEGLAPQLATLVDRPPVSGEWLWELKFDGYRLLTRVDGDAVRCFTRNGHDWTDKLPALADAIRGLRLGSAWLDGEIVVPDAEGRPDFQALQNAFDRRRTGAIVYALFDLPFHAGQDLRTLPLVERRERLRRALGGSPPPALRFSEALAGDPATLLASAQQAGLEGLIGKRTHSPYRSDRSADWIKLKTRQRQEFVVGGFTEPKGTRGGLGSLLLGVHDADGALRYAGNVGSGFDEATLAALRRRLDALEVEASPFADAPAKVGTLRKEVPHWVKPALVAEVSFAQWTGDHRLRQAVFHGLRADKPPRAITKERAMPATAVAPPAPAALPKGLRVTHAERVVDRSAGITKGELVAHYAQVAPLMLPHLKGRPVSLLRAPGGLAGHSFFQKHADATELPGVQQLPAELDRDHDPLLAIGDAKGLLGAAQMNTIEFHTWNATLRQRLAKPDRLVFDLDPGEGVAFARVREAAALVRGLLEQLGLPSRLKTSGGKGLHVVVPIAPRHDWDTAKDFSRAVVEHVARLIPDRFSAKSGPKNRVGRIFIDYLRNGFGATTVAAWSVRARPGMGVSVPVAWEELDGLAAGDQWNVRNIAERLALGNAPWDDDGLGRAPTLTAAIRTLAAAR